MSVLVDSNVLIFCIQQGHPWHEESVTAIERLLQRNELVCVMPQNIAEFWNVCTRPADKNGLGLSPGETEQRLDGLDTILSVLHDTPEVYFRWRRLLVDHAVRGIQVHDARIAAGMLVHGVEQLLTYNPRDFGRYVGIKTLVPREVS
ncbi:MAG: PIN domain-containing protein [Bryobacteraceae bacterium]|nr:PIN domain-containing protein [Bryobacteraceae bacterium]